MARARITRVWPDLESVSVSVSIDGEHPDALDMLCARVARLYAEAVGITVQSFPDEEE
jgi:hypothetical protein